LFATKPVVVPPPVVVVAPSPEPTVPPIIYHGDLIKGSADTVYYVGNDGMRHAFPHRKVYDSWYPNFDNVKRVTTAQLAAIPLGQNVTYRPGSRLIKLMSVPVVFAVEYPNILRPIMSEAAAIETFGANWSTLVDDMSEAFYIDYVIGDFIEFLADFDSTTELLSAPIINNTLPNIC
jgi:hypothetical protein